MDEKYLQQLWEWTTSQDPTFDTRYTFDSWKQKLNNDENYRQQFHSWVSETDETFAQRRPFDSWSNKVKKKDSPQDFPSSDAEEQTPEEPSLSRLDPLASEPFTQEKKNFYADYQSRLKNADKEASDRRNFGWDTESSDALTGSISGLTGSHVPIADPVAKSLKEMQGADFTNPEDKYFKTLTDDNRTFPLVDSEYGGEEFVSIVNPNTYQDLGMVDGLRDYNAPNYTAYSFGEYSNDVQKTIYNTSSLREDVMKKIQEDVIGDEAFKKSVAEDNELLEEYKGKFSALPREMFEKSNSEIKEYLSRFDLELDDLMFDTEQESEDFRKGVSQMLEGSVYGGQKGSVWSTEISEKQQNLVSLINRLATEDAAKVAPEVQEFLEKYADDNTASMELFSAGVSRGRLRDKQDLKWVGDKLVKATVMGTQDLPIWEDTIVDDALEYLNEAVTISDVFEDPRLAGKINRGSYSYSLGDQKSYQITDQFVEDKAKSFFNIKFNQLYKEGGEAALKDFVSGNIPEELKDNKEAVNAIDDILFNSMGLTLNVGEDKIYNDKPVHVQLKQAFSRGLNRTFVNPVHNVLMAVSGVDKQARAETLNEKEIKALEGTTVIDKSIKDSFKAGDYRMAFNQQGVGVAENAPQLGLALLSRGRGKAVRAGLMGKAGRIATQATGPGILGYSSYVSASTMAYTDPRFAHLSDGQKNGYAMRTGFRDGAAQYLMGAAINRTGVPKTWNARTQKLMTRGFDQSRFQFVRDWTIGAGMRVGLATTTDAISEATIENLNYLDEVSTTGKEFSEEEMYRRMEMAFASGGLMTGTGATFRAFRSNSLNSANYASERAFFYEKALQTEEISNIDKQLKKQEKDKKLSSQEEAELRKRKEDLVSQRGAEFDLIVNDRKLFFEMMKQRFPEQSARLDQLNMEINDYLAKSASPDLTNDSKKAYKQQINSRLKEIQKIKKLYSNESLDLTFKESGQSFRDQLLDVIDRKNENLEIDKNTLEAQKLHIEDLNKRDADSFEEEESLNRHKETARKLEERISNEQAALKELQTAAGDLEIALNSKNIKGQIADIQKNLSDSRKVLEQYVGAEFLNEIIKSTPDTDLDADTEAETAQEEDPTNFSDIVEDKDPPKEQKIVTPEAEDGEVVIIEKGGKVTDQQVPNLDSRRAEFSNIMFRMAETFGVKKMVVLSKKAMTALSGEGKVGFVKDDVIYISPESADAVNNTEQKYADAQGISVTSKSFEQHLLEEVMHPAITNKWKSLDRSKQLSLLNESMGLINNPELNSLITRAVAKASQYAEDNGTSNALVYDNKTNTFSISENYSDKSFDEVMSLLTEEVAFEPLLAYAEAIANNDKAALAKFTPSIKQQLKQFLKNLFASLGFKKGEFEIDLDSDKGFADMMFAFTQARKGNAAAFKQQKVQTAVRESNQISPYALPEEGSFTVKFNKDIEKWHKSGGKKAIGSFPTEQTFNGKWHFINWWKKVSNSGKNNKVFDFTFEGKPIDIASLQRSDRRESSQINLKGYTPKVMAIRQSIYAAEEAGIISPVIRKKLISKTYMAENMAAKSVLDTPDNSTPSAKHFAMLDDIEAKTQQFLERESEFKNIPLTNSRSSTKIVESILNSYTLEEKGYNLKDGMKKFEESMGEFLCKDGSKSCYASSSTTRAQYLSMVTQQFLQEKALEKGSIYNDLSLKEKAVVAGEVYGKVAKFKIINQEYLDEYFGGSNPADFYENTKGYVDRFATSMIMTGQIGKDSEALRETTNTIMSLILAATSQVNSADKNVLGASQIVFALMNRIDFRSRYRTREEVQDGEVVEIKELVTELVPSELIEKIRKAGASEEGFDYVNALPKEQVANNLEKLNRLFNGETVKGYKLPPNAIKAQKGGGLIIDNSVFDLLNTFYTEGNTIGKSDNGAYVAQEILGDKIGAFSLNLHHKGNDQVITIDSHVNKLAGRFLGEYTPYYTKAEEFFEQRKLGGDRYKNVMEVFDITGQNPDTTSPEEALEALANKAKDTERGSKEKNLLKNIVNHQPSVPDIGSERREAIETFVNTFAAEIGRTPADAMQVIFADDQVYNNGKSINGQIGEYTNFATELEKVIENQGFRGEIGTVQASKLQDPLDIITAKNASGNYSSSIEGGLSKSVTLDQEAQIESESYGLRAGNYKQQNVADNKLEAIESHLYVERKAPKTGMATAVRNANMGVNSDVIDRFLDFGSYDGYLVNVQGETTPVDVSEASFDGVKVSLNPFRANAFTDIEGRPIKSVEDLTLFEGVGYARGVIEYFDHKDPSLISDKQKTTSSVNQDQNYMDKLSATIKAVGKTNGYTIRNSSQIALGMSNDQQSKLMNSTEASNNLELLTRQSSQLRMRQFAKRMKDNVAGVTRRKIIDDPENWIAPQKLKEIKKDLTNYTDEELTYLLQDEKLRNVAKSQDSFGVLAGAELINRALEKGEDSSIPDLVKDLAGIGTSAGRILRQFAEMKKGTAEGMYRIFKAQVESKGNVLSEDTDAKLNSILKQLFAAQKNYDEITSRAVETGQEEEGVKKAYQVLQKIKMDLSTLSNSTIEKGLGDIFTMMVQGNLFTPLTHARNLGGNTINVLAFQVYDPLSIPIEKLINAVGIPSKNPRSFTMNAYLQALGKMLTAFPKSTRDQIKGVDPDVESEWTTERGLYPLRSLITLLANRQDLPLNSKGRKSLTQQVKLAIQSLPTSVTADINFRALTVGDVPFRAFGETALLHQIAKKRGLKGDAKKMFLKYPPKDVVEETQRQGAMLTFQKQTAASKFAMQFVNSVIKDGGGFLNNAFSWAGVGKGKALDGEQFAKFVMRATILPFVATPANIYEETLTFLIPAVAAGRAAKALANGDPKEASHNLAKMLIGMGLVRTAVFLIKEGLFSGPVGYRNEEDEKKRNLMRMTRGMNTINVSAVDRYRRGEDHSYRPGDTMRRVESLGILGTALTGVAMTAKEEELKNRTLDLSEGSEVFKLFTGADAAGVTTAMLKQTFLQGTDGILKVLATEDADSQNKNLAKFLSNQARAAGSAIAPNVLSTITRYDNPVKPDRPFDPDLGWEEQTLDRLDFAIKERMFDTESLPVAIDWRGKEIKSTPEGADPLLYHFLDVTKAFKGTADPVANEALKLYRETGKLVDVIGYNNIAKNRKQRIPSKPRRGLDALALNNYKEERKKQGLGDLTFFDDPEFTKSVRWSQEQRLNIMKDLYTERYNTVAEYMTSEEYKKQNPLEKIESIDKMNQSFNSAIEVDGEQLRSYSKKVLNAIQEIYDQQQETYVEF